MAGRPPPAQRSAKDITSARSETDRDGPAHPATSHTQIRAARVRAGFTRFGRTSWTLTDQARFAAARCPARTQARRC